jgi:putative hydrolase of the HAD superfamily
MQLSIVFDLDDTLYLERDYVRSGFVALDRWVAGELGVTGFGAAAQAAWDMGEHRRSFDVAMASLGIAIDAELVAAMLAHYRAHVPDIALQPDAADFVRMCQSRYRTALITDGPAIVQQRKIDALQIRELGFDPLIPTDLWGAEYWKPHRRAFRMVEEHHGLPGRRFIYVADNPAKDFIAPRALGWTTVQINREGAVHPRRAGHPDHAAHVEIESLTELTPELIERLLARPAPTRE